MKPILAGSLERGTAGYRGRGIVNTFWNPGDRSRRPPADGLDGQAGRRESRLPGRSTISAAALMWLVWLYLRVGHGADAEGTSQAVRRRTKWLYDPKDHGNGV